jgi:hypothetical protein
MFSPRRVFYAPFLLLSLTPAALSGELPKGVIEKIDAVVACAYQAASAGFPCKVGLRSKPRMLRWQDVDKCLSSAANSIDWARLVRELEAIRPQNAATGEFEAAVEASLSKQALPYNKVFLVKRTDVLLPLTNSILKYLPAGSLMSLPISDLKGKQLGTFAGVFPYEHSGGLKSGTTYTLIVFQYADDQGKIQAPSDRLLLDSYGVPWDKAMTQPGFRLTSDKLTGMLGK